MKFRSIFFTSLFLSVGAFAQTGCIIVFGVDNADTKIYTVSLGSTTTCNSQTVEKFNTSTFTALAPGCSWSPNPAAAPATLRNCIVGGSCGVKGTFTQSCPLDSNDWALLIGIAIVGILMLQKQNRFVAISTSLIP